MRTSCACINSPHTVEGLHDLLALRESGSRPDALVIPKCKSAEVIQLVAEVLGGAEPMTWRRRMNAFAGFSSEAPT